MRLTYGVILAVLFLVSCTPNNSLNQYATGDVGISRLVEFGTVVNVRQIKIRGEQSGTGLLAGAGTGAAIGNTIGDGDGNVVAIVGGVLLGAIAGSVAEQAVVDNRGVEYTVTKENGQTVTIAQHILNGEGVIAVGQRVMVQSSGSYQRVILANSLPSQIKRPKGIRVLD